MGKICKRDKGAIVIENQQTTAGPKICLTYLRDWRSLRLGIRITPARRGCLFQRRQKAIPPMEYIITLDPAVECAHPFPALVLLQRQCPRHDRSRTFLI